MKSILKKIVALRGVHYACLYTNNEVLVSTFPESSEVGVATVTQAIEQMFSALQAIGKAHNEVYFSLGEMQLIGYLFDEHLVVLLADSKINLPLIHMGVKSASVKIKALSTKLTPPLTPDVVLVEEIVAPVVEVIPPAPQEAIPTVTTISPALQSVMDNIKALLIDYLGPAAIFVFDDGVDVWREQYVPTEDTLLHLSEILALELNAGDERSDFMKKAKEFLSL